MTRILLIDDDKAFQFMFDQLMESCGENLDYELHSEDNAFTALEYLNKLDKFPDYIFVDLLMPIMNGWDFLAHYKKHFSSKHSPRIIMISGSTFDSDRDKAVGFSFVSDFIAKPIELEDLSQVFTTLT